MMGEKTSSKTQFLNAAVFESTHQLEAVVQSLKVCREFPAAASQDPVGFTQHPELSLSNGPPLQESNKVEDWPLIARDSPAILE